MVFWCLHSIHRVNSFFWSAGWKHFFCRVCKEPFSRPLRPIVKNQIFCNKTTKKLAVKLFCDICIQLTELNFSINLLAWEHFFCRIWKGTFQSPLEPLLKNQISHMIKSRKKLSVKLLCDGCIQLTELNFSFDSKFWKFFPWICEGIFQSLLRPTVKYQIFHNQHHKKATCETELWCMDSAHRIILSFVLAGWKHSFCRIWEGTFRSTPRHIVINQISHSKH